MSFHLETPDASASSSSHDGQIYLPPQSGEQSATYASSATPSQVNSIVTEQQLTQQFIGTSLVPSNQLPITASISTSASDISAPPVSTAAPPPPTISSSSSASNVGSTSTTTLLVAQPSASLPTSSFSQSSASSSGTITSSTSSATTLPVALTPKTMTIVQSIQSASGSLSTTATPTGVSSLNDGGHQAPFYVGVILGTILAIGFLFAVIAWAIRLRMHARRMRDNPEIPWANYREDDGGLGAVRDATFIGQPINRAGSEDISSQDAYWGQSEHSDTSSHGKSSHIDVVPGPVPYVDHQPYPIYPKADHYSTPFYHSRDLRNVSPNGNLDETTITSLGPLQVTNWLPGDTSPSSSRISTPTSVYTAQTGNSNLILSQVSLAERRDEPSSQASQADGVSDASSMSWTSSIKSNFTNAFNSVAANLPSGAALMINRQDKVIDDLTPPPKRRASRRSLSSMFSRKFSSSSLPWTLEERSDGSGRVHFHDIETGGQDYNAPGVGTDHDNASSASPHPPQSAFKPGGRNLRQPSMRSTPSNASSASAYSMASGVSGLVSLSAPRLPALTRYSTIKLGPMATVDETIEVPDRHFPSQKRDPGLVRRKSSTGSVYSYYYGEDEAKTTEKDESLIDQRSKFRTVKYFSPVSDSNQLHNV